MIEKALVVGGRLAAQIVQHALDAAGEVRNEMAARAGRSSWPAPSDSARDFDIISSADALHAGAGDDDARPRTSPSALVYAVEVADAGGAILVRDQHLAHDRVGNTVTRPVFSAGTMWTSAELYFATTSQPAMQLPQKWQAGRAFIGTDSVALRTWTTARAELRGGALHNLVAALDRNRRKELAVGQVLEAVAVAADTDLALDPVVVRRDVLVVDRPVLAGAVEGAPLEIALAEPKRHGIPQHGLAADAAAALGVEAFLAGRMVGICRLGNSNGIAWVLKSVRVLTRGPPSTSATLTPCRARCDASVPPPAPEPTMTTSKMVGCIGDGCAPVP